mgnify:FL=1
MTYCTDINCEQAEEAMTPGRGEFELVGGLPVCVGCIEASADEATWWEAMLQVLDGLRDSAERMQAVADRHPDWAEYASPDRTHAARASRYAKEADELAAEIDHEAKREEG